MSALRQSARELDRAGMIAKIHVAKKQLALTEECYRALLARVGGGESLKGMDASGLDSVLREFKRLGFKPRPAVSADRQVRMIYGIWREMAEYVAIGGEAGLRGFCERQTGVSRPEWMTPEQRNTVIEGLKAWMTRAKRARWQA